MLDPRELLDAIMLDFGMDPTGMSKPVMLHRAGRVPGQQRQAGRLTLLVIDEAQNLSPAGARRNPDAVESRDREVEADPDHHDRAAGAARQAAPPQLEQLRQRITVSYHLQPLDADETANYINHRLSARRSARRWSSRAMSPT